VTYKPAVYLPGSGARIETGAASNAAALFLEALRILQGVPFLLYSCTELLLKKTKLPFSYGLLSTGWLCSLLLGCSGGKAEKRVVTELQGF